MRLLVGIFASVMRTRRQRRNLRPLGWLGSAFPGLLAVFSVTFHWLMARVGQEHSWATGVSWNFLRRRLGRHPRAGRLHAGAEARTDADVQILSRSNRERNVSTLHRAGADFVTSYATTGATAISNLLKRVDILPVAEGLHGFRLDTPPALVGRCLAETDIHRATGCTVIAIGLHDHFDPSRRLPPAGGRQRVGLIGDAAAESRFIERFGGGASAGHLTPAG